MLCVIVNSRETLQHYGGPSKNNLNEIIKTFEDSDEEVKIFSHSTYYDIDSIKSIPREIKDTFSILSLNVQSLNAKFSSLETLLPIFDEQNIQFDALCLQESWLSDSDNTDISGYHMINQGYRVSLHGGLVIYLKNNDSFAVRTLYESSDLWEGQCIDVTLK